MRARGSAVLAVAPAATLPDRHGTRDRTYADDESYTILLVLSRPLVKIVATGSHKIVNGRHIRDILSDSHPSHTVASVRWQLPLSKIRVPPKRTLPVYR